MAAKEADYEDEDQNAQKDLKINVLLTDDVTEIASEDQADGNNDHDQLQVSEHAAVLLKGVNLSLE